MKKKQHSKAPAKKAKAPSKTQAKKNSSKSPKKTKKSSSLKTSRKSGAVDLECFLTSACMQQKGFGEHCPELNLLRSFRDAYLKRFTRGKNLVKEYYKIAPQLVQRIESDPEKKKVYNYIYGEVQHSCSKILIRENEKAMNIYLNMVESLMKRYV